MVTNFKIKKKIVWRKDYFLHYYITEKSFKINTYLPLKFSKYKKNLSFISIVKIGAEKTIIFLRKQIFSPLHLFLKSGENPFFFWSGSKLLAVVQFYLVFIFVHSWPIALPSNSVG